MRCKYKINNNVNTKLYPRYISAKIYRNSTEISMRYKYKINKNVSIEVNSSYTSVRTDETST